MKVDQISEVFHHIIDKTVWDVESDQVNAHVLIDQHFPDTAAPATSTATPVVAYVNGIRFVDGTPYTNTTPDAAGFTYSSGVIYFGGAPYSNNVADANGFSYVSGVRYSSGVPYSTVAVGVPSAGGIPTA